AVFSAVFKVYSTFSGRRFTSDLCQAAADGHISRCPHYNSIFNYLESPELTPILLALIQETSRPLASVESDFAVDSTGICSNRFVQWFNVKHGRQIDNHDWVKLHLCCGVQTNIVTAVDIGERNDGDAPKLPGL